WCRPAGGMPPRSARGHRRPIRASSGRVTTPGGNWARTGAATAKAVQTSSAARRAVDARCALWARWPITRPERGESIAISLRILFGLRVHRRSRNTLPERSPRRKRAGPSGGRTGSEEERTDERWVDSAASGRGRVPPAGAPAGSLVERLRVPAREADDLPGGESDVGIARWVRINALHAVQVHDRRAVDAQERRGVELFLQPCQRLPVQVRVRSAGALSRCRPGCEGAGAD